MKILNTLAAVAVLSLNSSVQGDEKGPAESMGEAVGPYIAAGVAGAATSALPLTGSASVAFGAGTGALGVHAVGDLGKTAGGAYGSYIDNTGNNPFYPSIHGKKPGGGSGGDSGGGCGRLSFFRCALEAIK